MANEVTFKVSADVARAFDAIVRLQGSTTKLKDGFRSAKEESSSLGEAMKGLKDTAHELLAEYLSFEGVKTIFENISESIQHSMEQMKQFNQTAAGAQSLPTYLERIPEFNQRSVDLATAFGVPDVGAINKLREKIAMESPGASDDVLQQYERSVLTFQKNTGSDATAAFEAERGLRETYPKLSVQGAEDSTEFLREHGLKVEEQQALMQKTLPAYGMMHTSLQDVLALTDVISHAGGDSTSMGRSLKELFIKIPELKEKGDIKNTGSIEGIVGDLMEWQNRDQADFIKGVGRRGAVAASFLSSHPEMIRQARGEVATFRSGTLETIGEKREAVPGVAATERNEQIEAASKNANIIKTSPQTLDLLNNWETEKLGSQLRMPSWMDWWRAPQAGIDRATDFLFGGDQSQINTEIGQQFLDQAKRKSGTTPAREKMLDQFNELSEHLGAEINAVYPYASKSPSLRSAIDAAQRAKLLAGRRAGVSLGFENENGDIAGALSSLRQTEAGLTGSVRGSGSVDLIQKFNAVLDKFSDAVETHKKAAETQQRTARRINSH